MKMINIELHYVSGKKEILSRFFTEEYYQRYYSNRGAALCISSTNPRNGFFALSWLND